MAFILKSLIECLPRGGALGWVSGKKRCQKVTFPGVRQVGAKQERERLKIIKHSRALREGDVNTDENSLI